MNSFENLDKIKFIFGSLFILANKMQVIGDKFLGDVTSKQWFLLIAVNQFENTPPTLSQVAAFMGTSHQNAKQIALKLVKKGFLVIDKDLNDSRALRLRITPECEAYFKERDSIDTMFLVELFQNLNTEEVNNLSLGLYKLTEQIGKMDKSLATEKSGWITNMLKE